MDPTVFVSNMDVAACGGHRRLRGSASGTHGPLTYQDRACFQDMPQLYDSFPLSLVGAREFRRTVWHRATVPPSPSPGIRSGRQTDSSFPGADKSLLSDCLRLHRGAAICRARESC